MIVETQEQYKDFLDKYEQLDSILIPIFSDAKLHPLENTLSLLYVKLIGGIDYILPFKHNEAITDFPFLLSKLNSDTVKYTYDKKKLNHIIRLKNVVDVNLLYYLRNGKPLDISDLDLLVYHFYASRFYDEKNINESIPILKHLEYCRNVAKVLRTEKETVFHLYNDEVVDILTQLEAPGIYYNEKLVYTEYNMFTSTGRPSSRFGGINFAALNKEDGSRTPITSRFDGGLLVEFDYCAYHLRLIANIVGYEFTKDSVYKQLAKEYGVEYAKSKALSFKYLYGGIPYHIKKSIPFFGEVDKYIRNQWEEYKSSDFIKSYIYNKKIYKKNMDNMTSNRLFNWTIQLLETENNWKMLTKLFPFLNDHNSKLILYGYDSFTIDWDKKNDGSILSELKKIIEQDGKYPVRISYGKNYNEMKNE